MTSSSDLRESLLKQNGSASVEAELKTLDALVQAQDRRARRLTFWTVFVWVMWVLSIAMSIVIYAAAEREAPFTAGPATQQAAQLRDSQPAPSQAERLIGALIAGMWAVLIFILPIVWLVLLIMMIFARRSASVSQIRASLASLDAQLRLLAINAKPPSNPPQA